MLVFAIWAVNLAFNSYQSSVTGERAGKYLVQGTKLYNEGKVDDAIDQWRSAIRVSPESKQAKAAEENIYKALVNRAYASATQGSGELMDEAQELIDMRPKAPEGHYYAGRAYELQSDPTNAKDEYHKAIECGGNDQYAIAARERLAAIDPGGSLPPASAPPTPPQADNGAVPFEPAK